MSAAGTSTILISMLNPPVGRDFRHHRPARRTGAQARRHHNPFDRTDRKAADHAGQQRRLCAAARNAARIDGRQQEDGGGDARKAHKLCDDHKDSGSASLLEVYIDETERRTWSCRPAVRKAPTRRERVALRERGSPSLRPAAAACRNSPVVQAGFPVSQFCGRLRCGFEKRRREAVAAIRRRREMPISFSMIVLSSQMVVAVADGVPNFDVARSCKLDVAATTGLSVDQSIKSCVNDEQKAKRQLASQWSKFPRQAGQAVSRKRASAARQVTSVC